jgi:mRNA deadenylase 3'-5' endonuclease subunit Ccr4
LADLNAFSTLAQESFYTYCDNAFLVKERRLPLVLHEILQYQADIICLQEVDSSIFRELLKPVLEHRNYQGFYAPKEGTREGGAMFWSLQAFERVNDNDHKKFVIRTLFDTENCLNDWTSMRDIGLLLGQHKELSLLVREKLGHVLQRVTLTSKASQKQLVAANTHLFFHPMASHIRLLQMYACLHELARQENPIVFCGDFNSSPTSGAARLVFDGIVEPSAGVTDMGATWKHLNTLTWGDGESSPSQLSVEAIQPPTISLPKSFPRLCSGYPELPKTTHHIQSFSATLDYILVSQQDFGSVSWAVIPSEDVLTEHVAMPSEVLPSDHVCLVCDLAWS